MTSVVAVGSPAPDVLDTLSADLDLSNRYLAMAVWLGRERLPDTARLFRGMSDAHTALAYRAARLSGRGGRPIPLAAMNPPRATFASAADAAREALDHEAVALARLDAALAGTALVHPRLAADASAVLAEHRRLLRAASVIHDAASRLDARPAHLEHWARKGRLRVLTPLPALPEPHQHRPTATTDPTYSVSTGR